MTYSIIYRNITVIKRGVVVLEDINLGIRKNKLTAIMGLSGAGKTSLLKVLSGYNTSGEILMKRSLNTERVVEIAESAGVNSGYDRGSSGTSQSAGSIRGDKNRLNKTKEFFASKYGIDMMRDYKEVSDNYMRNISSLVYQSDVLPSWFTINEYLTFLCRLIGEPLSSIDRLLAEFDMLDRKHCLIGEQDGGISGGQRKRLSIIAELLSDPKILFLDEPTTGLDVRNASVMVKSLKNRKKTIVLTIHQPSSNIFFMFDDLIVLHDKRILMQICTEDIFKWLEDNFFKMGQMTNPADYIFTDIMNACRFEDGHFYRIGETGKYRVIDCTRKSGEDGNGGVLRVDNSPTMSVRSDGAHNETGSSSHSGTNSNDESAINTGKKNSGPSTSRKQRSFIHEFLILTMRNFKMLSGNKLLCFARVIQAIVTSVIIGTIYFNVSGVDDFVYEKNVSGLLYFLVVNMMFTCSFGGVSAFYKDERLAYRETRGKKYGILCYYLSKLLADLPFIFLYPITVFTVVYLLANLSYTLKQIAFFYCTGLALSYLCHTVGLLFGAAFKDHSVTLIMLPTFITPIVTISGLMVNTDSLIEPYKRMQYISPTRYAFNIVVKNHFRKDVRDKMLKGLVDGFFSIEASFIALLIMILFCIVVGYFMLRWKMHRLAKY